MYDILDFLIPFIFVLAFALPGDIYWFIKKRNFVPSCPAEAKEHSNDKKVLIAVNVVSVVMTLVILGYLYWF